jgi:hypothetical protein
MRWDITNDGAAATHALVFSNDNEDEVEAMNECTAPLQPTESCVVHVRMTANGYGARAAELQIGSDNSNTLTLPLTMNSVPP